MTIANLEWQCVAILIEMENSFTSFQFLVSCPASIDQKNMARYQIRRL